MVLFDRTPAFFSLPISPDFQIRCFTSCSAFFAVEHGTIVPLMLLSGSALWMRPICALGPLLAFVLVLIATPPQLSYEHHRSFHF